MHLRKHDLLQMNDEWLKELLLEVSKRLLDDVKELHDRLNQYPDNSSRPPTSQAPWERASEAEVSQDSATEIDTEEAAAEEKIKSAEAGEEAAKPVVKLPSAPQGTDKKPGKQPGSQGFGRTQKLTVTATCEHQLCGVCFSAGRGRPVTSLHGLGRNRYCAAGRRNDRAAVPCHASPSAGSRLLLWPCQPCAALAGAAGRPVGEGRTGRVAPGGAPVGRSNRFP